jgi:uncharacterized protein
MSKLYTIITHDKAGAHAVRMEKLKEHLAHVEATLDQIAVAGPLRNEAGEFVGSMLVIKADSAEAAQAFLAQDPYFKADIWSKIDIHAFNAAAGDWVGGKTW